MKPTILVVEDCESTREGLVQVLIQQGYRAVPAENGLEAIAYLNDGGPADVILLDLMMPVMDGWTFRRAQLRDPWLADIPVVALSALTGRPARGVMAAFYLQKPLNLVALLDGVRELCDRRHAHALRSHALKLLTRTGTTRAE